MNKMQMQSPQLPFKKKKVSSSNVLNLLRAGIKLRNCIRDMLINLVNFIPIRVIICISVLYI